MRVQSRICVAALWVVSFFVCVAEVTVSAVTGTSCRVSWNAVEGAESYYVRVGEAAEPFLLALNMADYDSDAACRQALESCGVSFSNIALFTYSGYTVYGICLGDDWSRGYIKLPAVPRSGVYRLSVSGYAYAPDVYATLYVYEDAPDGSLLQYMKFCNYDDYYEPEQIECSLLLEAGTQLVLSAGLQNIAGAGDANGRIILHDIALEEFSAPDTTLPLFQEQYDAHTFSCEVENLQPDVVYCCEVTATADGEEVVDTACFATLPCTEVYPLPDSEIGYSAIDVTSRMCVTFPQPVKSCDVAKVMITPQNWTLAEGETQAAVRLLDSNDDKSVVFQVNSWNTCLELNTRYVVTFAAGAVTFVDGSESPSFSYSFYTGGYPTALRPAKGDASLFRRGDMLMAAKGEIVQLYDIEGRFVMSGNLLDMSSLPHGVYIVRSADSSLKLLR